MENNTNITAHALNLEQCKKLTATAIESVEAFSSQQIVLTYSGGKIIISGSNLKIINFSKSSGAFSATGEVICVKYGTKGVKLVQKLFK